jgi:hypothetical protein
MRSEKVQAKLSASKMEAASLCPAYWQANKLFAFKGDYESANEGTIRHEHEEHQTPVDDIDDEERRLCAYRSRVALEDCRKKVFGEGGGKAERELRLWYDDSWSGQLDYCERQGVVVFIADYKMLHGSHTPAPNNVQLLAQAVLYWKNFPDIETIYAALIEPFNDPWYTSVKYSSEYLSEKSKWLEKVVEDSYANNPKRVFGHKQCKWCSALISCPEAKSHLFSCFKKKDK